MKTKNYKPMTHAEAIAAGVPESWIELWSSDEYAEKYFAELKKRWTDEDKDPKHNTKRKE